MSGIDGFSHCRKREPLSAHLWRSTDAKKVTFCDVELSEFACMMQLDRDGGQVMVEILSDKADPTLYHNQDKVEALCIMINDARDMLDMAFLKSCQIVDNPANPVLNQLFREALVMQQNGGNYKYAPLVYRSAPDEDYIWYPNLIV